jgi:DNA repair ATPase RecN
MGDDAPETLLTQVTEILEEHSKILQNYRQAFEQIFEDTKKIKERLDKLESTDSLDSDDAKFLRDMTTRLKAISSRLQEKD